VKQARPAPYKVPQWQQSGFALYVHWPFCQSKCPYCDFNSHVAGQVDQERWLRGYISEMNRLSAETERRVLKSIFFGGGTPSLMEPRVVERIIDEASRFWTFSNDIEITLEANPSSVEAARFTGYRSAGVNRVSIGVQALNDTDLRRLGRMHSAREAMAAIRTAQSIFDRYSFDLIYARQDQSISDWESELRIALSFSADHISLYQLTIEPGTIFGERHAMKLLRGLPADDLSADMYTLTQYLCEDAGMPAYEISNHAKIGEESRHNQVYWNCGDFAGIGPGAHGRLTSANGVRSATNCVASPDAWLKRAEAVGGAEEPREILSSGDQADEFLIMGLRLSNGINIMRYEMLAGRRLSAETVYQLVQLKHIEIAHGNLRATSSGRLILNAIIGALAA